MIREFFRRWREKRAQAAVERARVQELFESFVQETKPLVPRAPKHPEAALFRHAWKRAVVLEILYQRLNDEENICLYRDFQELASERYYRIAPVGPYGTVQLRMAKQAAIRLLHSEIDSLSPSKGSRQKRRPLACIYLGICEQGRVYVGQTVEAPEKRWIQHRIESTGPFKRGAQYVSWRIAEGSVTPEKLDEKESFHIGLHDAYESGYNDTRGQDWSAYERGNAERLKRKPVSGSGAQQPREPANASKPT